MRCPGCPAPTKGHATNREALSSARPRYPTPTPAPATYNSPGTPAGTGRNHASSTNNAAFVAGEPIGTAPTACDPSCDPRAPAVSGALIATHIVVSVGP